MRSTFPELSGLEFVRLGGTIIKLVGTNNFKAKKEGVNDPILYGGEKGIAFFTTYWGSHMWWKIDSPLVTSGLPELVKD